MSDLILSRERFDSATNTIVQFLRDSGYTGSLEDGTGLHDVVIKPNAIIYGLFAQMVDRASAYQSLQKALELKDAIGQEDYDDAVDSILSNWFVTRNDGKPSYGHVRLWFLQPVDFLQYRDGQPVGTVTRSATALPDADTTLSVVADGGQVFTEDSFGCVLNTTSNINEYYVDVSVRSAKNSNVAPDSTDIVSATVSDIYFLRASVPAKFVAGVLVESSEDFIRRAGKAITTRELITDRAISTVLREEFDEIIDLYVAGHGKREQLRDIVDFQNVRVHVGNKADIWIATGLTRQMYPAASDADGFISTDQLPAGVSVAGFAGAYVGGSPAALEIRCSETLFGSAGYLPESIRVPGVAGTSKVELEILTDPALALVSGFVRANGQRVVCYDPLVKHKIPLVLGPVLDISLVSSQSGYTDEDLAAISARIKDATTGYVSGLVKTGDPWVASELVAAIHKEVEEVHKIQLPVSCRGRLFDPLSGRVLHFDVTDKFSVVAGIQDDHSQQLSDNTVQLYTDEDLVTVNFLQA